MHSRRNLLSLALIALLAIGYFRPTTAVQAAPPCDTGASTINQTIDCTGNIVGLNDTTNTITNHANVDGTISGGNAVNAEANNTILNLSGAVVNNTSGNSYLFGGENDTISADLTVHITNFGTVFTVADNTTAYVEIGNNNSGSGNNIGILTNFGTISANGVNVSAYMDSATNNSDSGNQTSVLSNAGTISTIGASTSAGLYTNQNTSNSGSQTNTLSNSDSISSDGNFSESYMYVDVNNSSSGNQFNTLTNSRVVSATGTGSQAYLYVAANKSTSGNVTSLITNSGTISANGGTTSAYIQVDDNRSSTGNDIATIINFGTMSTGDDGDTSIEGPQAYSDGTTAITMINNGTMTSGNNKSSAELLAYDNHSDHGTMSSVIINNGSITVGDNGSVYIYGSYNYSPAGTVTNTIVQNGLLSAGAGSEADVYGGDNHNTGSVTNTIIVGGVITTVGTDTYTPVYGGNNYSTGVITTNIYISGSVLTADSNGISVFGGKNTGGGMTTNTTHLIGWSPTISGIISGDGNPQGPNGSLDQLFFEMQTTNEGLYNAWQAEIAAFGGTIPDSGSITWGGKTYTWQDMDELVNLVKLLIPITWFNPGDGRFDGQPADRIAVYCHADKDNLGVLLVNGNSKGNVGTSFVISKLEALGNGGTSVSFGSMGILSIMMDSQGNGYAAWNGGTQGATGQGNFAKTFSCPLPGSAS